VYVAQQALQRMIRELGGRSARLRGVAHDGARLGHDVRDRQPQPRALDGRTGVALLGIIG
jgi:hypothetical protein